MALVANLQLSSLNQLFYFVVGNQDEFVPVDFEVSDVAGTLLEVFVDLVSHIHLECGLKHGQVFPLAQEGRIIIEEVSLWGGICLGRRV